jgi:hypothetical protein
MTINATGHQGSWFAKWQGQELPCIHEDCVVWNELRYHHSHPRYNSGEQTARYIETLKTVKRVILTKSPEDADGARHRERYLGVFDIDNARLEDGVQFTLVRRVA